MRKKTYVKGIVLALLAGILWGITGPLGQYLFDEKTITPEWLVTCRLIASGSVILLGLFLKRRLEIFTIWKIPPSARSTASVSFAFGRTFLKNAR